jgi:hypothetical protein
MPAEEFSSFKYRPCTILFYRYYELQFSNMPVRPIDPYLPKVHINVILPPTPRSSQWSLTFGPPNQSPPSSLPHVPPTSSSLI